MSLWYHSDIETSTHRNHDTSLLVLLYSKSVMKDRNKPKENKLSAQEQRKLVKESIDADLKLGQTW